MSVIPRKIREIPADDTDRILDSCEAESSPAIIRGLAADWPLVHCARKSTAAACDYLLGHDAGKPVTTFTGEPGAGGRLSYTDGLAERNFRQTREPLERVLTRLQSAADDPDAPPIYVGSRELDIYLPGLGKANSLLTGDREASVRIWIGNRTAVAAHYDALENIACVCAGRRRFTLFPPEQLANLYIGPIDFTPAGQSISLVDLNDPDFERFPRFAEALGHAQTAVLEPGDAVFIPSLWWHAVEGLESFNILINHWWRNVPAYMGAPGDALLHAILSIRDLPAEQRSAWRSFFDHYVFDADEHTAEHIPADRRGPLGGMTEDVARRIRALLRNNLNR